MTHYQVIVWLLITNQSLFSTVIICSFHENTPKNLIKSAFLKRY